MQKEYQEELLTCNTMNSSLDLSTKQRRSHPCLLSGGSVLTNPEAVRVVPEVWFVLLCMQCTTTTSRGELILYMGPLTKLFKGKVHPKSEFQPFTTHPSEEALVKFPNPHKCFGVWGGIPPMPVSWKLIVANRKKQLMSH